MKIRKIIPLLAIAVLALFALSSCDQMLESIYPKETTGLVGQNAISLDVYASISKLFGAGGATINDGPLMVVVKDSTGTTVASASTNLVYSGYDYVDAYFYFPSLPDQTYYIYAWIDANKDGVYNELYPYIASPDPNSTGYISGGWVADVQMLIPN